MDKERLKDLSNNLLIHLEELKKYSDQETKYANIQTMFALTNMTLNSAKRLAEEILEQAKRKAA